MAASEEMFHGLHEGVAGGAGSWTRPGFRTRISLILGTSFVGAGVHTVCVCACWFFPLVCTSINPSMKTRSRFIKSKCSFIYLVRDNVPSIARCGQAVAELPAKLGGPGY